MGSLLTVLRVPRESSSAFPGPCVFVFTHQNSISSTKGVLVFSIWSCSWCKLSSASVALQPLLKLLQGPFSLVQPEVIRPSGKYFVCSGWFLQDCCRWYRDYWSCTWIWEMWNSRAACGNCGIEQLVWKKATATESCASLGWPEQD